MSDSNPPKLERRFSLRTPLVFALLVLSGCGPSQGERTMDTANEQQAVDAYNRGVDHFNQGELDKAIADFTEAIRLNPKLAGAYFNRGFAYVNKGELNQAVGDWTEAIRLDTQ